MKTTNELKKYTQIHIESFFAQNKDSIVEAFEASKENESITLIEYLDDLITEASHNFGDDCIVYTQDQWDIVYAFKFGFDSDYYYDACDNACDYDNIDDQIQFIAFFIMESLFRESLEVDLNKYEQQKLMQIA
jgi:hypothetical protein